MKRKLLGFLLVLCLAVACVPVFASAVETDIMPVITFDTTKAYKAGDEVTVTVSAKGQSSFYLNVYTDALGSDNSYISRTIQTSYDRTAEYTQAAVNNTVYTATFTFRLSAGNNYIQARGNGWTSFDYEDRLITETVKTDTFSVASSGTMTVPTIFVNTSKAYDVINNDVEFTISDTEGGAWYGIFQGDKKISSRYQWFIESTTDSLSASNGPGSYVVKSYSIKEVKYDSADYYYTSYYDISTMVTSGAVNIGSATLKAPTINVENEDNLFANQPLVVKFTKNEEENGSVRSDKVLAVYSVTRDSDGADVTIVPKVKNNYYYDAIARATKFGTNITVTDDLAAGTYTIKAKLVDTAGYYSDSPETVKKVTVKATQKPELTLNSTDYSRYSSGIYDYNYRIGETLTATISAPGFTSCEVQYTDEDDTTKTQTIAITNGKGTLTLPAFTKGTWNSGSRRISVLKVGDIEFTDLYARYTVRLPKDPTITTDKETYNVGDTVKITITGANAEYYTVELDHREQVQESEDSWYYEDYRDIFYDVDFKPVNDVVTLEVPITEAGRMWIYATAVDESKSASSYESKGVSVGVVSEDWSYPSDLELAVTKKVTITTNDKNSLLISWNSVSGANTYRLFRAYGNGEFEEIATLGTTSYVDKVTNSKLVHYRVQAAYTNAAGNTSFYGPTSGVYTYELLKQPTSLKAKSNASKTLNISWKKAKDADYYEVYYSTSKKAPTAKTKATATVKDGLKLDTTKGVKAKKTYYVYVRAVRELDDGTKVVGPWTSVKKIKTKK